MATKAKKQQDNVDAEFGSYAKTSVFAEIPVEDIMASPTNPRKVFHEKPLDELAASIARVGVLEPVLVRLAPNFELVHGKRNGKPGFIWENIKDQLTACWQPTEEDARSRPPYEIIAGERRWRASQKAGLYKIPVIIKDLSDEQTLEIQIDENWQRKDLEPMDEARGLKFIMDKRGWSLEECAARLSKDVRFLAERLKLNDLIEECQTAMDDGKLLVTHAYVIARYSEADQKKIVKDIYGKKFDRSDISLSYLRSSIEWRIEKKLGKAVFDLKAIDLRTDGLACVNCPQRAGANPTLFDEIDPADDRCLDSKCFDGKIEQHWLNLLAKSTKDGKKKFGPDYEAPCVYRYSKPTDTMFANAIGGGEWCESIVDFEKGTVCASSETAIFCGKYDTTREIKICRNKECPDHAGKPKQSTQGNDIRGYLSWREPADREAHFDREVARKVSTKVLETAASEYAKTAKPADLDSEIAALVISIGSEIDILDSVSSILETATGKEFDWVNNHDALTFWVKAKLTPAQINEIKFLGLYSIAIGNSNANIITCRTIADKYGIDYRLLDAQVRTEICPANEKGYSKLTDYLTAVTKGDQKAKIPRLWDKKYESTVPVTLSDEEIDSAINWNEPDPDEIDDNAADGNSDANDELVADSDEE